MINIVLVAAGGAIGSVFRYLVGVWSVRLAGVNFPWGTLTVNVVGSFLIGLLVELVARRLNASMEMRLFLVTGVLGGFTTFSSFSLDAVSLFERGALGLSAVYVLASLSVSIAAVFAGLALGRNLF
ncbi:MULTISPECIES: fluoride efflux transporter CrcB [Hyphomicrobiales]|jgi:fluoride exporter|uniref:Fluoride-specific ion channel FluC n=3 Tax=Hyphomicrobiales TaxID=356 RepID=A0A1L9CU95_9HYPH|nr:MULTISPECIES: fluoride efflux transporter CrcB [Rhizobium/Agrobacterium group]AMD59147.1 protein CrcB [Agrobacterium tumefaciens]ANV22886.1 protein CrcB [Rhizobium sp. S41]EKJ97143.1 camphor resistance protein CrcB [Bradyrhizobium lupini HPC(L)]KGE80940.1 protein CrcB [Rhizobium sp. H41]MBB2904997.1 CrcB protein [Rhizobium sp. RAS22]MBM7325905.1 fluoride efflux transporter CrcB [Agrobacterium sp. S2]MDP9733208.1 CrcB protein [Rhizobium sp. SORGH_AS_0285]MDP9754963.1 CrcB protein [Rhizobi